MSGPRAYYNEIDPKAAAWLRELIARNLIAPGDVDERSIEVVAADDLKPYTQCHFFAGIGVWSYALRRAGWDDARPVWTGSCPCQPFSSSGRREGFDDPRHLWPHFYRLVCERRPGVCFGEQVAGKDGLVWLDLVQADLEAAGYANAALDLCAAGFGAPHIRQRLYWVADAGRERCEGVGLHLFEREPRSAGVEAGRCSEARGLVDAESQRTSHIGLRDERHRERATQQLRPVPGTTGGDGARDHSEGIPLSHAGSDSPSRLGHGLRGPGPTNGFWGAADWLLCTDGKWRPVEPGTFPLAHGAPARVGRLRGYGNAINAEVATAFIEAYTEARAG